MKRVGDAEAEAVTLSWLPSVAYEMATCACVRACMRVTKL